MTGPQAAMLRPEKVCHDGLPGARSSVLHKGGRKAEDKRYLAGDFEPKYWCFEAGIIGLRGFRPKTYAFLTIYISMSFGWVFNFEFCHNK